MTQLYKKYYPPLEPDSFFHIYNRGIDGMKIFFSERNYIYFLQKFDKYLSDYVDVYAYCLLGNHFHLLIKLKTIKQIFRSAKQDFKKGLPKTWGTNRIDLKDRSGLNELVGKIVSKRLNDLFVSYSKAINKQEDRTGKLLEKPFRRIKVDNPTYLSNLIHYIHNNPVHHEILDNPADWQFSSYNRILIEKELKLKKEEVLNYFGGKKDYLNIHKQKIDLTKIEGLLIEE